MKLIIENEEYPIKQAHFSINMNEDRGEDIEVIVDGITDISGLAQSISSIYNGSLIIRTDSKDYIFNDFNLETINANIIEGNETISIRFRKPTNEN